jgi:hypothetical protein
MNRKILAVIIAVCAASKLAAEPRFEVDFWTGYSFPVNQAIRDQCNIPATGNYCRIGGMSFGTGLYIATMGNLRSGVGFSYLPISSGTLKVSDTILVNISTSYAPIVFQVRYDIGPVHIQVGSGYALTVERPRVYSGQPVSSTDSGVYAAASEIGFRSAISEQVAFYAALKYFALVPLAGGSAIHTLLPSFGVQANLGG